jgi:hypothetical protein
VRHQFVERSFAAVEAEINEERAAALGRSGRRVQLEFERCRQLGVQIDRADEPGERQRLIDEYRAARAAFEHRRWQLHVHREAIGLNDHRWVDRVFPMPARR